MTLREIEIEGWGAQFMIHVPPGWYRIEGNSDDAPPLIVSSVPAHHVAKHSMCASLWELISPEYSLAETLWTD